MTKLDKKSLVDESKFAKIETELCKVRADYKCEIEKLNAKYSELSHEHESTKFVLESRLEEAKSEVGNLKENIQSLKYDNNFLLDILQSNESIWSKPKRTCPSKSVPDRTELSILNSFGALEDETHVVRRKGNM